AEVVIDIAVVQISRHLIRTLGTTVPTSTSIALAAAAPGTVKLGSLNGSNFQMAVPGGSFDFLMSDNNTKVLQNPEIRVLDQQKAQLKIVDRIPIATGSFSARYRNTVTERLSVAGKNTPLEVPVCPGEERTARKRNRLCYHTAHRAGRGDHRREFAFD